MTLDYKQKRTGLPQGVYRSGKTRFRARIKVNGSLGKMSLIGTYDTVAEASAAYQEMRILVDKHRAAKIAERLKEG